MWFLRGFCVIFSKLFKNRPFDQFQKLACKFLNENFDALVFTPVQQKLQEAKEKGEVTAILSSSPDFLVKLFAERFDVDEWVASKYELDKDHKFSAISTIINGEAKVKYMHSFSKRRGIPLEQITAYSDSYLDFPLLKAAGHAVGVKPDNKLRALCKKYHWDII